MAGKFPDARRFDGYQSFAWWSLRISIHETFKLSLSHPPLLLVFLTHYGRWSRLFPFLIIRRSLFTPPGIPSAILKRLVADTLQPTDMILTGNQAIIADPTQVSQAGHLPNQETYH